MSVSVCAWLKNDNNHSVNWQQAFNLTQNEASCLNYKVSLIDSELNLGIASV